MSTFEKNLNTRRAHTRNYFEQQFFSNKISEKFDLIFLWRVRYATECLVIHIVLPILDGLPDILWHRLQPQNSHVLHLKTQLNLAPKVCKYRFEPIVLVQNDIYTTLELLNCGFKCKTWRFWGCRRWVPLTIFGYHLGTWHCCSYLWGGWTYALSICNSDDSIVHRKERYRNFRGKRFAPVPLCS